MNMLLMQCLTEIRRLIRNPFYLFFSLLMPVCFYLLYTNVLPGGSDDGKSWAAYYLMSMTAFSVMGTAVVTLCARNVEEEKLGFTTLVRITPLPSSYYLIAKMIGQTLIQTFSLIVIFLVGIFVNGVSLPLLTWLACALWITAGSFTFLALGTLLGSLKRVDVAVGVSNMLYFALAILGGMWMPIEMMPKFIQNIGQWLPSYSYRNGVWMISDGHMPEVRDMLILAGYMILFILLSIYLRNKKSLERA